MNKIVGIQVIDFTENGKTVKGVKLHTIFEKSSVQGHAVESFYIKAGIELPELQIGDTITVVYNRYGKVCGVNKI